MKTIAAVLQFEVREQDKAANLAEAERLIKEAAGQGAQVLLLPELWNCGYDIKHLQAVAEPLNGESIDLLRRLAAELRITIIGGSIIELRHGQYYNTSALIDAEGRLVAKYRKVHLFTFGWQEHKYFSAGDEWVLAPLAGPELTLGMSTCYDLRFPEFYRNMALRGARLFSAPSAWPLARISEYELFCRARAAENRCFLLSANYTDSVKGLYCGNSLIVDPLGQVVARGDNEPRCLLAELDTDIFSQRHCFNSLADRKQFLDEIDDNQI